MNCPKVALICGISGSGKTKFARLLEEKGFFRLSLDEELYPDFYLFAPLMTDEYRAVLKQEGINRIKSRMVNLIADGKNVALDMPFCKRAQREDFCSLIRSKGAEPMLIFLDAELSVLKERLAKRQGKNGWENLPVSEKELERFWNNFERPDPDENFIFVNANREFDIDEIIKAAL